jgi:hypothetical protein
MEKVEPINLVGIPQGGSDEKGDGVWFTLVAEDDRTFTFRCPHEVVGEIVQSLEIWAQMAWKMRGSPDEVNVSEGTPGKARSRSLTGFKFALTKNGIVITLVCGPLSYDILVTPDECSRLSEALARVRSEWNIRLKPN